MIRFNVVIIIRFVILISLISVLSEVAKAANATNFYDQRYRGWLWFEESNLSTKKDNIKPQTAQMQSDISPAEAKAAIESFAKELEDLKFMMLARPSVQNIKAYRDKEKEMWDKALKLHDNWDMANLLYPEQRDLINNPVNVHAVKAKRSIQRAEDAKHIKEFATKFTLVLFFDANCKYCKLFSPVLKSFAEDYGFIVEAVSGSNSKHQYFKTSNNQQLIEQLGIKAFPTVIVVSNDGETAFELIRGYVSISELEEYSLLAIKHLVAQEAKKEQIAYKGGVGK